MHLHPKKQIWLLRHAATEWSVNGRHTGRSDIPLLPEGEAVARAMRPTVEAHEFALCLASPMQRAQRTAELMGLGDRIAIDPDLKEWDYGDYEGITTDEIRTSVPNWTVWSDPCPHGETGEDVAARARHVIDRAMAAEGDVALFSHGHFLRVLGATWLGLSPADGRFFKLDTGTLSILGFEHEYRVLQTWNARIT
jgi:probable phosphoglycerate mutase